MDLRAKRIALYARYSSDRQNPRSIDDQLRVCRERVAQLGGAVDEGLVFTDAATSGASNARPGFEAMQSAMQARLVDVVVTEDLSRIGRNLANTATALEDFKSYGARLIAINDGLDTDQEDGGLVITAMKGVMGQLYLSDLGKRTKRGQEGSFRSGGHVGKKAFGYRIVPADPENPDKPGRRLVVVDAEAKIVRRVFDLYLAGNTQRAIAERLNAEGLHSPHGRRWAHTQVRSMLANETYAGVVYFNQRSFSRDRKTGKRVKRSRPRSEWLRREDASLRIVDAETWHAARAKAKRVETAWKGGQRQQTAYPLSGLLVCDLCGQAMTMSGSARRYYQCGGQRRGLGCTNSAVLREPDVRAWLFDELRAASSDDAVIGELRSWWASSVGGEDGAIRRELGERRAKVAHQTARLKQLLLRELDEGSTPTSRALRADLEDDAELQRAAIVRLEARLKRVPVIPSPEMIRAYLAEMPALALKRPAEARELLGELLAAPARCKPPQPGQNGYRVRLDLRLDALAGMSAGSRSNVVVAGAGFAVRRAPVTRIGYVPAGYAGGRP